MVLSRCKAPGVCKTNNRRKKNLSLKKRTTPRHVPSVIIEINDIPRTISGKKVEIAVSKIINGEEVENKDSIANPESLVQFSEIEL